MNFISKKGQIEKWIVYLIIAVIAGAFLIYLLLSGLLPKTFDLGTSQLKPPSLPK